MPMDTIGRAPNGKATTAPWPGASRRGTNRARSSAVDTPHVLYDVSDSIATMTLNRPEKRNAFSPEMIVRLCDIWTEIAADPAIRVVLLTGAGDQAFSSGGDLGTTIPLMMRTRPPVGVWGERFAADRKQLYRAILRGADFFKPVVAAINGHALAGGGDDFGHRYSRDAGQRHDRRDGGPARLDCWRRLARAPGPANPVGPGHGARLGG